MRINYNYIAIEGNIGAGKTTLAKFLSNHFNGDLLLEEFNNNKFLSSYYATGDYALQTEIQFLIDRSKQIKEFFKKSSSVVISDYYPNKSLLFSKMNLLSEEFEIIKKLHSVLFNNFYKPEILIFIDSAIDEVYRNIKTRNRNNEEAIDLLYLENISRNYESWLLKLKIPVLRIKGKTIDYSNPNSLCENFEVLLSKKHSNNQSKIEF
ncbi:MAG: deoxynucleoside kinase [Parvicellaceae bacterium]